MKEYWEEERITQWSCFKHISFFSFYLIWHTSLSPPQKQSCHVDWLMQCKTSAPQHQSPPDPASGMGVHACPAAPMGFLLSSYTALSGRRRKDWYHKRKSFEEEVKLTWNWHSKKRTWGKKNHVVWKSLCSSVVWSRRAVLCVLLMWHNERKVLHLLLKFPFNLWACPTFYLPLFIWMLIQNELC